MANFPSSNLSRVLSVSFSFSSGLLFDINMISSRNAFLEFRPSSVVSIIFGMSREVC